MAGHLQQPEQEQQHQDQQQHQHAQQQVLQQQQQQQQQSAQHAPAATDSVTDAGLQALAQHCKQLKALSITRKFHSTIAGEVANMHGSPAFLPLCLTRG